LSPEPIKPAPIDTRSRSKDENPLMNFDTGGKIIVKVSEKSKAYMRSLRKMCIELSQEGIPEKRDTGHAFHKRSDYLEQFPEVCDMTVATFESLIDDGCLPFVALRLINKSLEHKNIAFLTNNALRRILNIDLLADSEKINEKFIKNDEYKFQSLSKHLTSLQSVANSLEKRIDNQTFLAGFCRHSTKDVNLAVYSDDLQDEINKSGRPAWDILQTVRNTITGEIEKEVIDSIQEKYEYVPDSFMIELDSLSMLHFIKRLLLLHREDPFKTRRIYYSPDRKKIIKII
jgi:hypothetical protein